MKSDDVAAFIHSYTSIRTPAHQALLAAYDGWKEAERRGQGRDFCWRNFLSSSTLRMVRRVGVSGWGGWRMRVGTDHTECMHIWWGVGGSERWGGKG